MIKVNSKKAIKLLTKRTLEHNRPRNLIAIIAIAMTTFLLTTVFFIGINAYYDYDISIQRYNGTTAHATLSMPTEKQIDLIKDKDFIKNLGFTTYVAISEQEEVIIALLTVDEQQYNMVKPVLTQINGSYPNNHNEIMLSLNTLSRLGVKNPDIGMEIVLPYQTDVTHWQGKKEKQIKYSFQLSGWFTDETYKNQGSNYGYGYVTEEFALITGNSFETVSKMDIQFISKGKAELFTDILNEELNLTDEKKIQVYNSLNFNSEKITTIVGVFIIVAFLIFSGYLLIYNIFYISVAKDIRYYGLLKTIGTTKKQLTRIVMNQAIQLSFLGIPIGVVIGLSVSFILIPTIITLTKDTNQFETIKFNPNILIISVIFSFITVLMSARKPSKMVGELSPVEAIAYTGVIHNRKTSNSVKSKRSLNGSKIAHLAWRNVFRDKKRALIVILSLILGLTTFVFVITIVNCIKVENYVNYSLDADIQVGNNYVKVKENTYELSDSIDMDLAAQIQNLEGIKDVYVEIDSEYLVKFDESYGEFVTWIHKNFEIPLNEIKNNFNGILVSVDTDMMEKYLQINHINMEAFERGEIALIDAGFQNDFTLPESFRIRSSSNSTYLDLKFGGFIQFNSHIIKGFGYAPTLIVSKNFVKQFDPNAKVKELYIYTQKGKEVKVNEDIKKLTESLSEIYISSKENIRAEMKFAKIILNVMGGGISLILAFIGIINYVNIMISGVQVRTKELAVLESIGMTKKQIEHMLILEGVYYGGVSLVFVWTLGNALTYGLYRLFKESATYASFDYPFIPIIAVSIMVLFICILLPMLAYKQYTKVKLMERIRME
jgi:putative ABC transport system permease protein